MVKHRSLTPRHKAFIHHYVFTSPGNASEAARLAGYKNKTIGKTAEYLLKRPDVKAEIDKKHAKLLASFDMTEQDLIANVGKIAKSDEERTADRIRCLELLSKIKGLYKDNSVQIAIAQDLRKLEETLDERFEQVASNKPAETEL